MIEVKNIVLDPFFNLSQNYMFIVGLNGKLKAANYAFRKISRMNLEDTPNTLLDKLIHPEDWDRIHYVLNLSKEGIYRGQEIECRIISDHQYYWIKWTSISKNEDDDFYIIAHDITENKKNTLENQDIQNKLFQIIELVPHPIFLKNNKGKYTLVNQAQASLFSISKEKLIGKDDSSFIKDATELDIIRETDNKVIHKLESIVLPDQTITCIDGNTKILHTIKIPFQSSKNEEVHILGVSIDLTEIKKVENDLRTANFELDSFVYRSSHDLRAPLCSLTGLLSLIEKEKNENIIKYCVDEAKRTVRKLDSFIADLTNLSRNSRLQLKAQVIEFEPLINDCLDDLKFMDNAAKIQYSIKVKEEVKFYSDEDRLKIIFMNLLSNSIKYQRKDDGINPQINIDINCVSNQVVMLISDNGVGIEKEYHSRIFEMFFRASEVSFGSGLGLYIVKQTIEKMNGHIELDSEPGSGTKIKITIPN